MYYIYMYVYTCVCMYMYVYVYVRIYVYKCVLYMCTTIIDLLKLSYKVNFATALCRSKSLISVEKP